MSDVDDTVKHEKLPHQLLRQWLTVNIPNEIHRYAFLDPTTDEIRLITLLPSDETSARIECLLSHVSLNSKPDYEALSYAWGDQKEDIRAISLGGKPFPVTQIWKMHCGIFAWPKSQGHYGWMLFQLIRSMMRRKLIRFNI